MNSHPHDSLPTALYSARQVRDLDARLIAADQALDVDPRD